MSISPSLASKPLGKNGPLVPRLGLGLMGNSFMYGLPASDEERLAFLDKAYEIGERFWDTADMYGDSEDLLGKWFAANPSKRNDIFLATKFGIQPQADGSFPIDSSPEYCRAAFDKSLQRLGLPSVDLFYIHRLDSKTPVEKTMRVLVELKNAGKLKYIGLSDCSAESLRRAHAVHPISCVQFEYNVFTLDIESPKHKLLATARELGIAIVAYSPLGRGLLTGSIRKSEQLSKPGEYRSLFPRMQGEKLDKNLLLVDKITEIGQKKHATTTQVALAWLLKQGSDIFAIPGTRSASRLEENLGALKIDLSDQEEKAIRKLADEVEGGSHPEAFEGQNFLDTPPLEG